MKLNILCNTKYLISVCQKAPSAHVVLILGNWSTGSYCVYFFPRLMSQTESGNMNNSYLWRIV